MIHVRNRDGDSSKSRSRSSSTASSSDDSQSSSGAETMSRSPSSPPSRRDGRSRRARSRSRSKSRARSRSRSKSRARSRSWSKSRSRSWDRGIGYRHVLNPEPNRCLGIFGLNECTTERRLHEIFSKYGSIEKIIVIVDAKSGRSRGFGFAYFKNQDDAKTAKEECSGLEIDGRKIRVDFSITQRPHNPTPGIYMGKPLSFGWRSHDRYNNSRYDYYDRYDRYSGRDYDDYYDGGFSGGRRGYYKERRSPSYSRYRSRCDRSRSPSGSYYPRHTKPK